MYVHVSYFLALGLNREADRHWQKLDHLFQKVNILGNNNQKENTYGR